ncbi:hypothetical protein CDD80_6061 [Ophiocordyceps camponoti-rufipedis]|uniref:Uncharacterized protein n=1 Tax=Ophiocordyceps camponoti-rufipedis TaxID=2004952 RepID=A0A2C5YSQ1_9HYPO|nr:hypothetical protein CDD80_6061 [Ophiocordyceps camponoti-rufipedis]
MPSEPARQPATGNAREGGRGGRGRGRGRGRGKGRGANSGSAASRQKPTGDHEPPKLKDMAEVRVQVASDRQRDLEAAISKVFESAKPALEELSERTINQLLSRPDAHLDFECTSLMVDELQQRFDKVTGIHEAQHRMNLQLADDSNRACNKVAEDEFENRLDDLYDQFYDGLLNKLRLLDSLHAKGLPVDLRDDRFEYRVITDRHLDVDFGAFDRLIDGDVDVEADDGPRKTPVAEKGPAAAKTKAVRAKAVKRKAQTQLDGQPTPKKATRNATRNAQLELADPQPTKGLLAAAKEAAASTEANTPAPDDDFSNPTSPEPVTEVEDVPRDRQSPKPPKGASDVDEYGLRTYIHRKSGPAAEKIMHYRFMMEPPCVFQDHEIGFRDSTNDQSRRVRGKPKPNKFLGTPNSSSVHLDHRLINYDYSTLGPQDFDQDTVRKHNLHPGFGLFMSTSTNESVDADPYVMPGKPIAYIANPSGRVAQASRSYLPTVTERIAEEAPLRSHMSVSLRRFCKASGIEADEVATTDYVETDDQLLARSLGTAEKELPASAILIDGAEDRWMGAKDSAAQRDADETTAAGDEADDAMRDIDTLEHQQQLEGDRNALSALIYATAFEDAKEAIRVTPSTTKAPRYDAIRDVFTATRPTPAPVQDDDSLGLNFLAQVCKFEPRLQGRPEDSVPSTAVQDPHAGQQLSRPGPSSLMTATSIHLYGGPQDPGLQGHPRLPPARPTDYGQVHAQLPPPSSLPPPGPPAGHGQSAFYAGGYGMPDHRDAHMARPVDPAYHPRAMSAYATEAPPPPPPPAHPPAQPYGSHVFWTQPTVQHPYPPPTLTTARMPFSLNASAEPLPPLRPPRSRSHSLVHEEMIEPRMRSGIHTGVNPYYPPAPPRVFNRAYPEPGPPGADRVLPAPHQQQPQQQGGYMTPSSASAYGSHAAFGSLPSMGVQQSPPGTPLAPSASALHQRPDAANGKYRKLQPAPVPAHRAWTAKPELKTIFYDHKETGSSAALPNSGPTQIRGWNVNQPRKRSRQEKSFAPLPRLAKLQRTMPSTTTAIRRQVLPPLRPLRPQPRPTPPMVTAPPLPETVSRESIAMMGFGAIPTIGSALPLAEGALEAVNAPSGAACIVVAATEGEASEGPIKRRLRPRK